MNKYLEALQNAPYNLDLERREEFTADKGWWHDAYEADLPQEAPGALEQNGSFALAMQVLRDYRFPPPDLIAGIFLPESPLETRVMLLEARFLGFRFRFGVRVTGVTNEQRGQEYLWGYRYATLEGHFERGQIEFLLAKNLSTGRVQFRISAFSQTGTIKNIFYRLGFAIFGRRLQKRFARDSLARMQKLVTEGLKNQKLQTASSLTQPTASSLTQPSAELASGVLQSQRLHSFSRQEAPAHSKQETPASPQQRSEPMIQDTIKNVGQSVKGGLENLGEMAKEGVERIKEGLHDAKETIEGAADKARAAAHEGAAQAHEVKAAASDNVVEKASETFKAGVERVKGAIDDAKGEVKLNK